MNRRRLLILLTVSLMMLAMSACNPATPATPTPEPLTDEQLNVASEVFETTWTLQNFNGPDGPVTAVEDSYPSINFMSLRYDGYTGCNYFLGTYRVNGENQVALDPPAVTSAICETDELNQQEGTFLTVLITTEQFALGGETITLSGGGRELMTLQPLAPVPFEGTSWRYSFYQGESPQWQPAIQDTVVTAVFDGETISGNAGCNDYSGPYTTDGDVITIDDLAVTMMTCSEPPSIMEQEERFLSSLQTATHIRVSPRTIELFNAERPIMLFSAN